MKKLVLLGAGGHCESILDAICLRYYDEIVILDKEECVGKLVLGHRVVGTDDDLKRLYDRGFRYIFIAIGSIKTTKLRRRLWLKAKDIGYQFINVIDTSAVIAKDVKLGTGIFVGKRAVINSGAVIANMAIINTGAIIEHDCIVDEFSHISVGAVLCGNVNIEHDCFIGANATVIQNMKIPAYSVIGAGDVVKIYNCKEFLPKNVVKIDEMEGRGKKT